jgi:hypothetical protein
MAEERKRASLHDHSTSARPSSMRDEKPRDEKPREKKTPGDMKGRHRAERVAMHQAQRAESRDLYGNHAEEQRQLASRHEKAIADTQER